MKHLLIATTDNLDDIVKLRAEMQIEDWGKTLNKDFSKHAKQFEDITREHLLDKLGKSIYFAMMYLDNLPIAMCAIEELSELPQITICTNPNGRHGCVASVYTKPEYRGHGYQQKLLDFLLAFAKTESFNDITLTTNTPDAAHIYEKIGFVKISDKYFLGL